MDDVGRRGEATGVVFGVHAVKALIASGAGRIAGIWLQAGQARGRLRDIAARAREAGIPIEERSRFEIEDRVGERVRHQGVVALLSSERSAGTEADLEGLVSNRAAPALLLVLDGVQDPHNLGACMRTADAAGVQAIVVPRHRAVGLTPTVCKVACGAAETVPLIEVSNLGRCLRRLKSLGVWVVGASATAERTIYRSDFTVPLAIVLGAEGAGLRRKTAEHCDYLASIPLAGEVSSLNVSVAAGVCLFEVVRQRMAGLKGRP